MNILVVGGAGYIGSVTVEELVAAGERVIVYDSFIKGHRAAVHPKAILVEGDLADRARLEQVMRDHAVEAVMHFAAWSLVGESVQQPAAYYRNNVSNTLTLLEAMVTAGITRFVLSSTAAVYGEPKAIPITEDAPLQPTNPYGDTKLTIERMLHWFDQAYGLRYASLRYFNAAGASLHYGEDHDPETHLIPIVLQVALGQRSHVQIYGTDYPTRDGTCIRDYIHVTDLAQAHILALRALERGSCIYNLGNGQGFTVREVIEVCQEVTGHFIPVVEASRRPGDPAVLVASSEKIRRELGWEPLYPALQAIVESAWRWHQAHPHGYEA